MKKLIKAIYEHLITKRKYNTLMLKYEVKCQDYDNKATELRVERQIHSKQKEVWEKALIEQEEEIIRLKKRKVKNDSNSKK